MLFKAQHLRAMLPIVAMLACGEPSTGTHSLSSHSLSLSTSLANYTPIGPVVTDPVMGSLSSLARQVVVGLGNPRVRLMIVDALKSPSAVGSGLDFSECSDGNPVDLLLNAAEQRGAGTAAAACSELGRSRGLTLYMSENGLKRWDGTFVPIVTAVNNPRVPLPNHWKGYRSGTRTIDLFADTPAPGPVLVIVRVVHPARLARTPRMVPGQQIHVGPLAPRITPATIARPVQKGGGK